MYVVSLTEISPNIEPLSSKPIYILTDKVPTSHVECTYCPTTGSWGPPTVINNPNLQINGFAVGVNYGGPYYESLTGKLSCLPRPTKVIRVY